MPTQEETQPQIIKETRDPEERKVNKSLPLIQDTKEEVKVSEIDFSKPENRELLDSDEERELIGKSADPFSIALDEENQQASEGDELRKLISNPFLEGRLYMNGFINL